MATFVTLYSFTEQGIRNVKESPDRLEAGIRAFEDAGGEILAAYYVQGSWDLVVIASIDDEKTGAAFILGQGAGGNVRTTTMRAWSADEFADIVSRIP